MQLRVSGWIGRLVSPYTSMLTSVCCQFSVWQELEMHTCIHRAFYRDGSLLSFMSHVRIFTCSMATAGCVTCADIALC